MCGIGGGKRERFAVNTNISLSPLLKQTLSSEKRRTKCGAPYQKCTLGQKQLGEQPARKSAAEWLSFVW